MVLQRDVGEAEARFGPFGDSQSRRKIGAWFAPNVPREWKSFWAHPMVLLANVGQEEARFDPSGDSFKVVARQVHGLHQMYHVHGNRFGHI